MSSWQVEVLGTPRLLGAGAQAQLLERKPSALLAYLALEGPTSRAKLAALLWPGAEEAKARNSLSQTLRKLRLACSSDLMIGRGELRLADGVRVDACALREAHARGRLEVFVASYGDVLASFDFDDCPEFEDWLLSERERWQGWRRNALRALALDAEAASDLDGALGWARQLLAVDPASEEAYVLVMRLQLALGNRARALETLRSCEEMLAREFGVPPTRQTRELARLIREGAAPIDDAPQTSSIPLSVLRPPLLVGREREWALMEEAWAKGQGVCLVGEPGVGKSRLVQEFARAHGGDFYFECRPGDEQVLYGLTIRMLRKILSKYPQLSFEPWVTQQLAYILPEFGSALPMSSQADRVRFYQAMTEVVQAAIQAGMTVLAYDDTHHFDDGSAEAQLFMWGALGWGDVDAPFRIVFNSRPQEYTSVAAQALTDLVRTGRVLVIELGPLAPDAVHHLVQSMNVPQLAPITADLQRYTGGNPQFLLETVKHLIETGELERGFPNRLTPPGPVQDVVMRRLGRLSATALHAAQAAAVLQSDFTLELVAETLRKPLLDVLPAWQELERAQMLGEGRFSHDLVYEAVEANLPTCVREALHRSAARVLDRHGFPPSRVARHWLQSGEPLHAAPKLREAADLARSALRFVDAAELLEQAAALLEAHGDLDGAFDARHIMTRDFLKEFDLGERYEASVSRLFALARTEGQRARAWHCQGLLSSRRGEHRTAFEAAREGCAHAERSGAEDVQAELTQFLGIVALQANELDAATVALRRAAILNEQLGRVSGQLSALQNLGVVLGKLGRYSEAAVHLRALIEHSERAERPVIRMHALTNLTLTLSRAGRKREARAHAVEALELIDRMQGREMNRVLALLSLGAIERDLGRYGEALNVLELAREASAAYNGFAASLVLRQTASVYAALGVFEQAEVLACEALAAAQDVAFERAEALLALTALRAERGEDATELLRELGALRAHLGPDDTLRLDLLRARWDDQADLAQSEAVLRRVRASEGGELLSVAEMQHAHRLVRAGRADKALPHAFEAARLLDHLDPLEEPRARLAARHAAVLSAAGHPHAAEAARQAAQSARATALHVPSQYREAYVAFVLQPSPI
ncbi:AAA family ATPase [Deinococcus humi]|nr:AAA family ATPase [Deinococcus humi]